jgi:hypothetical protein
MTGNEMLSNLGLRLEDPAASVFTSAAKLDSLNLAQKTVCSMIDNAYLVELQTIANNKTVSTGACTFDTAFGSGVNPIRNGITGIYDETNDLWCTMIEPGDVKRLENSYLSGTTSNAVAYIFADTIYIKPTSGVSAIDVWYIKLPTDLAASGTECELNPALQEMVLDFAEAQLWRMDAKADRAQSAYNNALNLVKVLNERYQAEKPQGIGTKGR